jgi:hypothetical protein
MNDFSTGQGSVQKGATENGRNSSGTAASGVADQIAVRPAVGYEREVVAEHIALDKRVVALENLEKTRQRAEGEGV